jgi:hypothetical protein
MMSSISLRNCWTRGSVSFDDSRVFPDDYIERREYKKKNRDDASIIHKLTFFRRQDGDCDFFLQLKESENRIFRSQFKKKFPTKEAPVHEEMVLCGLHYYDAVGISVPFGKGDAPLRERQIQQRILLNEALDFINLFDPIAPKVRLFQVKKALHIDMSLITHELITEIKSLYASRCFQLALNLALEYTDKEEEESEEKPFIFLEALIQECLNAGDYSNFFLAISHEPRKGKIYEMALNFSDNKDSMPSLPPREFLKLVMQLFDLCGDYRDSVRLKSEIFSNLASNDLGDLDESDLDEHRRLIRLGATLTGDSLVKVADEMLKKNKEIKELKILVRTLRGERDSHSSATTVTNVARSAGLFERFRFSATEDSVGASVGGKGSVYSGAGSGLRPEPLDSAPTAQLPL